ncbi:hypothetical protein BN873_380062 [Candidatus Competibacter denitrificans Run_A_D11]|uniref:Uncharacterized protein n=1 Tax=Candidatus Competibacter denitrificans Run_A_D11 TaxID=1400863 RepID=W6MAT7_9GAMM|nr:hypothetical protein BN873_380062 [Candidatus Competibacter denitrificans Run_A_D11]
MLSPVEGPGGAWSSNPGWALTLPESAGVWQVWRSLCGLESVMEQGISKEISSSSAG